jgi:hypothetical protein
MKISFETQDDDEYIPPPLIKPMIEGMFQVASLFSFLNGLAEDYRRGDDMQSPDLWIGSQGLKPYFGWEAIE